MLAESPDKPRRKLTELQSVIAAGRTQSLNPLVSLENGPASAERTAFYDQSVTLAGLLLDCRTP